MMSDVIRIAIHAYHYLALFDGVGYPHNERFLPKAE
jgi:hypothetical protein